MGKAESGVSPRFLQRRVPRRAVASSRLHRRGPWPAEAWSPAFDRPGSALKMSALKALALIGYPAGMTVPAKLSPGTATGGMMFLQVPCSFFSTEPGRPDVKVP